MRHSLSAIVIALTVAACGSASTSTPTAMATATTASTPAPLSLSEIRSAEYREVTLDLLYHTRTVQARFVDVVYDNLSRYIPLGITDQSLLVYAMDTCETRNPRKPPEWAAAPGQERETQTSLLRPSESSRTTTYATAFSFADKPPVSP